MQTAREYLVKYLDETPDYFEHNAGKRPPKPETVEVAVNRMDGIPAAARAMFPLVGRRRV